MRELARVYLKGLVLGSGIATALTLAFVIAYAADILTIDKDGAIRFRVSDTGKVTLNTNEPAQGDLRLTQRAADPTAPLAGDLWYNATAATLKAKAGTEIANLPGKFTRYTVTKTSGDFTTTSSYPTWVDVTGMSVTFTTDFANQAVLVAAVLRGNNSSAGGGNRIDLNLDGTRLSGAGYGLTGGISPTAGGGVNLSCSYMTVVPNAGSHTVNIQTWSNTGETNVIYGSTDIPGVLQVLKFY